MDEPSLDTDSGESGSRSREFSLQRYRAATLILVWLPLVGLSIYLAVTLAPVCRSVLVARQRLFDAQQQALVAVPELEQKITALKEQTRLLTTESIDARVAKIELTLRIADVKAEQIASLEDTRKELGILKTYMFSDARRLVDLQKLQGDYAALKDQSNAFVTKDDLRTQVGSVYNLWTLSLWIFGIIVSIILVPKLLGRRGSIATTPTTPPPPEGGE
jgi:hypothetical protein